MINTPETNITLRLLWVLNTAILALAVYAWIKGRKPVAIGLLVMYTLLGCGLLIYVFGPQISN